jgi:hypothetical protein
MICPLRAVRIAALIWLPLALACRTTTAPSDSVVAVAAGAGIVATNGTDAPVFYSAYVQDMVAIDVCEDCCANVARCPDIPAGGQVTIPWSAVAGASPTRHEYWLAWHQAQRADGRSPLSGIVWIVRR